MVEDNPNLPPPPPRPEARPVILRGEDLRHAIAAFRALGAKDPDYFKIRSDEDGDWQAISPGFGLLITAELARILQAENGPKVLQTANYHRISMGGAPTRERRVLKVRLAAGVFLFMIENRGDPEDQGMPAFQVVLTTKELNF